MSRPSWNHSLADLLEEAADELERAEVDRFRASFRSSLSASIGFGSDALARADRLLMRYEAPEVIELMQPIEREALVHD